MTYSPLAHVAVIEALTETIDQIADVLGNSEQIRNIFGDVTAPTTRQTGKCLDLSNRLAAAGVDLRNPAQQRLLGISRVPVRMSEIGWEVFARQEIAGAHRAGAIRKWATGLETVGRGRLLDRFDIRGSERAEVDTVTAAFVGLTARPFRQMGQPARSIAARVLVEIPEVSLGVPFWLTQTADE